jgi:hypothetical protein
MAEKSDSSNRGEQLEALKKLARDKGILDVFPDDELAEVLNSNRPKIKLPADNRELGQFAYEIGAIVSKNKMYRRDRSPVHTNEDRKRLDVVSAEMLRTWVEFHLVCYKEKKMSDGDKEITITIARTMNTDTARGTLESLQFLNQLPEIDRVNETQMPVIMKNGSLELLKPGYFPERRIYTFDDGLKLDDSMTLAQAREVIDELLRYFPFPNQRSKSALIAAGLTMFCATMLPKGAIRPGFIFTANSVSAGKTLGAKVCIIPVVGSAATRTFPRKEEAKKVLDIFAMQASSYIFFDNIRGKIAGEDIEQFISSPIVKGRILGESREFVVENVATVFMTGNQSTTSPDMEERCLFIELFVEQADNRDRNIPHPIDDAWLSAPENRTPILSAWWAMVRAWDANGRPKPKSLMPKFYEWSSIIGGIVINAGYEDPLQRPALPNLGAVEGKDMLLLVEALAPDAGVERKEWKFPEIISVAVDRGLFSDVEVRSGRSVEDMFQDGEITMAGKSHFGKLLVRYDRRIFSISGRMLRFIVEGKGNSRKFAVIEERRDM